MHDLRLSDITAGAADSGRARAYVAWTLAKAFHQYEADGQLRFVSERCGRQHLDAPTKAAVAPHTSTDSTSAGQRSRSFAGSHGSGRADSVAYIDLPFGI
jgi:hypothetical protein